MTTNKTRPALLWVFIAFLILQLGCFFYARSKMWPEDFTGLVRKLLVIYSVQLGVVLGGIFSQQKTPKGDSSNGLNWTALLLVIAWNVLLASRSVLFSFAEQDSVADLTRYLDAVGSEGAFLVASVVTFFFGRGAQPITSTSRQGADHAGK